jgi:potassium efflux system protein
MRPIRGLFTGTLRAAVWPGYLGLAAYASRQAPWPRSLSVTTAALLGLLALAFFAANLIRFVFGPSGWAEEVLDVPADVTRQARRTGLALVAAHVVFLLPGWLLSQGLFAPGGRPVPAPTVVRGLVLAFELCVLAVALPVVRSRSPLFRWLSECHAARLGWLTRRRRTVAVAVLAPIVAVFLLDARGFSFSARRLASGMAGSLIVAAVCWGLHRLTLRAIDRHAWRWSWVRARSARAGRPSQDADVMPADLAARLRRLSAYLAAGLGVCLSCWVWDVDLALFEFISEQRLWSVASGDKAGTVAVAVTVGDLTRAIVILALCAAAWRHLSTCFAVAVFPRMPDDPGVRYAVLTLCRYAVLAVGLLCGLSAIHLGLDKIGMVLAALGVGLGFGLQEIVSNFVCGIILLLERPIRVGDIVTVSGTTGKVDRIHIRATTIINGDNQSMIVPNRAFVTGDLVNWTLRDKVIRVTVRVKVAHGTDPDQVADLLTAIARDDADVLRSPAVSALMEEISDSALLFVLHAHVPDPGLAGRVKHRLFAQIQRRFAAEGIRIPLPSQELQLKPADGVSHRLFAPAGELQRVDPPSQTPPPRHLSPDHANEPEPLDGGHRGVDG